MTILKDPITGQVITPVKISPPRITGAGAATDDDEIDVPRSEYVTQQNRLELVNALLGGTKAMKDAGEKFLPKEPAESITNYDNRLNRSYLFNAFGRTISYLGGQVFAQPVRLLPDTPSELRSTETRDGYEEDIDLRGNNLDGFLKPVFEKGIAEGITCVLVEYPSTQTVGQISLADERASGIRPYWVHLPSSAIIGWKTQLQNGRLAFTQLRIRETVEEDDGKYGVKTVNRIRVLEPGRWLLYEEQEDLNYPTGKRWKLIDQGTTSLDVIPLAVFAPGNLISALTAEPPLEDLAYMNLAHWQSTSDQVNILHFTRLPILFGRKITSADQLDQIEIGPNRMIHSDSIEGDLKYVEHTGSSIAEGRTHLTDLESKMAMWGLQLLMPKTGTVTATEKALASGESDSTLKAWALQFNDFIEQCLYFTALYLKKDSGGSSEVNTQFRWMQTLDAEILLRGAQLNVLPKELVFEELKRRAIVSDQYDYADVQAMFDEQNRDMMTFTKGGFGNIAQGVFSQNYATTSSTTSRTTGVGTSVSIKRGSGRKGGV